MFKIGSYDPFGHIKHKLWPKEGSWVKLLIWFPTIKSQESLDFLACRWRAIYYWKDFDKGYNFASNLISIEGLHIELWAPKVVGIPALRILGVPGQNDIWVLVPWPGIEYIIRGRWCLPPSPRCGESCESTFAYGLFVHQSAPIMH